MTRVQIKILQNHDALVQTAAERFVASAVEDLRAHGQFHVALSGGTTPKSLYAILASDRYAARVDWSRVHVFWGGERCVPPADPMSNYRMVRICGEDDPVAAAAYERELRHVLGTSTGPLTPNARFDLILRYARCSKGHISPKYYRRRWPRRTMGLFAGSSTRPPWRISLRLEDNDRT